MRITCCGTVRPEQWFILRDARILCEAGSYASAVVKTAFAREELGRKNLRGYLAHDGRRESIKQIDNDASSTSRSKKEAMFSVVQRADNSTVMGQLMQTRMRRIEALNGRRQTKSLTKSLSCKSRTPEARHKSRMKALYVEPLEAGWNRPAETSETAAREFLTDAINDYSGAQHCYIYPDVDDDPDFHAALKQWH
jgi:AbiV family abortive infection protein